MTAKIQIRRDTISNWSGASPTANLSAGEIGVAFTAAGDVHGIKIGPSGGGNWNSLPYLSGTLPDLDVAGITSWNDNALRTTGRFILNSNFATDGPSGSIAFVADDGRITCLSVAFGTSHLHIVTTEGNSAATPNPVPAKMLFRIYDGNAATPAWREWTPLSLWSSSDGTTGVNITAKSITLKDTATGLTVDGNSVLTGNVTVNGTTTLGNADADIVTVRAGLVGAPIITTAGDTDTGIYFPAANEFAIATGGTAAITVNSSQNVNVAGVLTAAVGTWPQCVQNKITTTFTVPLLTARPTNFNTGGITQFETTITPRFTTSKLLVRFSLCISQVGGGGAFILARRIGGTGTEIGSSTEPSPGNRQYGIAPIDFDGDAITTVTTMSFEHLDAPSTTSAVTYALYVYRNNAVASNDLHINRTENDGDSNDHERVTSTVTIQEFFA